MGTKVQCKSYVPGYYSMRDLNEDSNICSWPLYYGDKPLTNGQYFSGFMQRVTAEAYPGYDKDSVKKTMLEHEAIFKDQVYELHRLYRIQKDMMDEAKRKELHRNRMQVEASLSSSPLASQIMSEDTRKWNNHSFLMTNSICARPSISGLEGIHSRLSSRKGNSIQTSPYPSQNGCSSKDIEVLESRPTKVRRKTFDLQLPADEYIDTEVGEQLSDDKVSVVSSSYPGNPKIAPKNGVKFCLDDGQKTDGCNGDTQKSGRHLRSPNGLADLNEPIQLEDVKERNVTSYDFCNGKVLDFDQSVKPHSQLMGLAKEIPINSYGSDSGAQSNLNFQRNGNVWFSHVLEAGHRKSSLQSFPQYLQTDKSPLSTNKVHEPSFYLSDKSKGELWKEKTDFGVEISERKPDLNSNKNLASLATSHVTSPYQMSPPDLAKPCSNSWEKPSSSFSQKAISTRTCGSSNAATLNKSSQAPVQGEGVFGDRWYHSNEARSNPASGGEFPYRNGFYQGSSSGSKEQPIRIPSSTGDYLSSSNENDRASGLLINGGLAKYGNGSSCGDMKSPKDMNLNVVISEHSSNQEMTVRGIGLLGAEKKHEDHLAILPWLRPKLACKNELKESGNPPKTGDTSIFRSPLSQSPGKNETTKDCNQLFAESVKSFSSSADVLRRKTESSDCPSNKKLLGFPIFENPHILKNEPSSLTSENRVVNKLNRILDINLPCDPAAPDSLQQDEAEIVVVEKVPETKLTSFRHHIDLNLCLSDDEASLKPSAPIARVRIIAEIDLEAPAVPESDDDVTPGEQSPPNPNEAPLTSTKCNDSDQQDELLTVAAEAIMAISVSGFSTSLPETPSKESSSADPLAWFVEIISSWGDDLESKLDAGPRANDEDSSEEFDYFESQVLQLSETKEEDYMPTPLVPESLKLEETGSTVLTSRPRKGQARRGRQRRDFQRDILPGLASLSRHEVTEDLQTFGGLMRATGHPWNSGLTRRSSSRGRRRVAVSPPSPPPPPPPLVQHLNAIELGLDDRSLTGWGKTTRRPRRQRCPPGNPPPIPLT